MDSDVGSDSNSDTDSNTDSDTDSEEEEDVTQEERDRMVLAPQYCALSPWVVRRREVEEQLEQLLDDVGILRDKANLRYKARGRYAVLVREYMKVLRSDGAVPAKRRRPVKRKRGLVTPSQTKRMRDRRLDEIMRQARYTWLRSRTDDRAEHRFDDENDENDEDENDENEDEDENYQNDEWVDNFVAK